MTAVAEIYRHFGLPLTPPATTAMARRLAARPRGGYARHAPYGLKRFGISTDLLNARFAFYVDRYCRADNLQDQG